MKLEAAEKLAHKLLRKHKLNNWYFYFDQAKKRFGSTIDGRISISAPLTKLNSKAEFTNTMLHEIAHALVGIQHGHDVVWKRKAIQIGCDGYRLGWYKTPETRAWTRITCKRCKKTWTNFLAPNFSLKNRHCNECWSKRLTLEVL